MIPQRMDFGSTSQECWRQLRCLRLCGRAYVQEPRSRGLVSFRPVLLGPVDHSPSRSSSSARFNGLSFGPARGRLPAATKGPRPPPGRPLARGVACYAVWSFYIRAAIAYWGKVACFGRLPLAFPAVYALEFDSLRCGLNLLDAHKSLFFRDLTLLLSVFGRKCHDMRIFRPVQSPEKRGPPPILAPHYCWKQWGSTRWNRMAVPIFSPAHPAGAVAGPRQRTSEPFVEAFAVAGADSQDRAQLPLPSDGVRQAGHRVGVQAPRNSRAARAGADPRGRLRNSCQRCAGMDDIGPHGRDSEAGSRIFRHVV